MNWNDLIQCVIFLGVLLLLVKPLGTYMARIYEGKPAGLNVWLGPLEKWTYRLSRVRPEQEMSWKVYAAAAKIGRAHV